MKYINKLIRNSKSYIRKNRFIRLILNIRKKINDKRAYKLRAPYIKDVIYVVGKETSIISSNCFASRIMHVAGMEFNTPTLGLYF